ncbi:MAG: PaaI family thioesterase [Chloroflexota bacterium]|nr:PaaI family thioesterase [Chloroflexota bacterium]
MPRFELSSHNCFACGTLNAHGLHLLLHVEPGRSWSKVTLERPFEGWAGIAHGGILCTVLDEVMAWALVGNDNWGLTARLSVDFRKPVEIGRSFMAEGWVTRSRRRLFDTAGRLVDAESGIELARSEGVYVAAGDARKKELRERYGFRLVNRARNDTPGSVATPAAGPEATS